MPAESESQRKAAAIAYEAKCKGKKSMPPKGSTAYKMAQSMTCKELKEFAETKRKGKK